MQIWMLDRTSREFVPLVCNIMSNKGRKYIVWGRFRIRIYGDLGRQVFEDQYEIKKAAVTIRSRNDIVLVNEGGDKSDKEHLVAFHLVLPESFKGKCIKATNGKRIFYDYKKKGGAPSGYFSVMAFVYLPDNEIISVYDTINGTTMKTVIGNSDGELSNLSIKKA